MNPFDTMKQTYSSARTSINSTRLPAVYGKATLCGRYVFDIGCGRYTDHIRKFLGDRVYLAFDPFNQPKEINDESMTLVKLAMASHLPMTVICSNVLNVIDNETVIADIAKLIDDVVEATGGVGYVTVYEGNGSSVGRQTGLDQYQRNAPLRQYLRFFRNATIKNGMIVVGEG